MRKSVNTDDIETSIKTEPFTITWPAGLDMKPIHTVEVSATRSVHVYDDQIPEYVDSYGKTISARVVYKVVTVITKTGRMVNTADDRYHNRVGGSAFTSLLDARLWIEQYSREIQPKTKTVTQKVKVEINGDEDED